MAHSVHPAYKDLHQEGHRVKMNKGVVLKINANQRYCTNGVTGAIVRDICSESDVPLQTYIVNQNGPCGSTIGPKLSSLLGAKSADVGIAQLGMHSIRETCGVLDAFYYTQFFSAFYKEPLVQVTFN